MALHLVFTGPSHISTLERCLDSYAKGDAIVLVEDGVLSGSAHSKSSQLLASVENCYALTSDLTARGLSERLASDITAIDDAQWVALTEAHSPIISWFTS